MKKSSKSNLDEMKEQQLLHIERNGCWLAFWGLFIVQAVQYVMSGGSITRELAGEWLIFMILALYLAIACIRKGIWDRKLKPNFKTNLIVSLIAGVGVGILFSVKAYISYEKMAGAIATGVFMFMGIFICCMAGLSVSAAIFKSRAAKLESAEETEEK
jgi:hypothetical protein